MIVPMRKIYVAARQGERNRLLTVLRGIGVVHVAAIEPEQAVADEQTLADLNALRRADQILSAVNPAGASPEVTPADAAREVLEIDRAAAEARGRLAALHHQAAQLEVWGDVRLEQFEALRRAGLELRFFSLPQEDVPAVSAECVETVAELPGRRALVAVIDRGEVEPPELAEPVELPAKDRPTLRAEAAEIDEKLKENAERLCRLAHLRPRMQGERDRLAQKAEFTATLNSGLDEGDLYALQGWVPAEEAGRLAERLEKAGIAAAVHEMPPAEGEEPPTLVRYSKWAKPIQGLFDMLGTKPGYREVDLSGFFMVALPIFAAMLIGDAGYGAILLLAGLGLYGRLTAKMGKPGTHLLIVMGAATLIWGVLTANYFGITPESFTEGAAARRTMAALGVLWRPDPNAARMLIIQISFIFGTIHLTLAHLRQFLGLLPNQKAISELGWCLVLWAMLGVIWLLFFGREPVPMSVVLVVLATGAAMAVLFTHPQGGPLKRIGIGLASSILPLLGTFSDTMSYIRLMAVGLASYYIASAFNGLGAQLADAATWLAAAPVILFGHALNLGLAAIAIFAHGVRLNMLEFSNNAGVQWAGYAYQPFAESTTTGKES